jgi:hypothetical protein
MNGSAEIDKRRGPRLATTAPLVHVTAGGPQPIQKGLTCILDILPLSLL